MNPCSFRIDPGRILASGEQDGYRWEVVVNHMAYRCGYVRIPKGHPWFGMDYALLDVSCHGCLTFGSPGADEAGERDESEWWVGFDCAHAGDSPDPELVPLLPEKAQESYHHAQAITGPRPHYFGDVIRTTEYCQEQCLHIIAQAIQAATLETTMLGWTPEEKP